MLCTAQLYGKYPYTSRANIKLQSSSEHKQPTVNLCSCMSEVVQLQIIADTAENWSKLDLASPEKGRDASGGGGEEGGGGESGEGTSCSIV